MKKLLPISLFVIVLGLSVFVYIQNKSDQPTTYLTAIPADILDSIRAVPFTSTDSVRSKLLLGIEVMNNHFADGPYVSLTNLLALNSIAARAANYNDEQIQEYYSDFLRKLKRLQLDVYPDYRDEFADYLIEQGYDARCRYTNNEILVITDKRSVDLSFRVEFYDRYEKQIILRRFKELIFEEYIGQKKKIKIDLPTYADDHLTI